MNLIAALFISFQQKEIALIYKKTNLKAPHTTPFPHKETAPDWW